MSDRCEPPEELRGVDGWHWVQDRHHDRPFLALWHAAPCAGREPLWVRYGGDGTGAGTPSWVAEQWGWRYIALATAPAEVDALRAEASEWCQKAQLFEDRIHKLRAGLAAVREALALAGIWHEEQEKALSKQPPSGAITWRRLGHREQSDAIRAALGDTP